MGGPKLPMTNFTKGEAAPDLYSRVDIPQYGALARRIHNFIIQRQGGLKFRPGFRFIGEADSVDGPERMIPFLYRQDEAYIQVLSDFRLREMTQGGFVVEEDLKLVSATNAGSMVVEVPFHDYNIGDRVFLDGNEGMDEINGRYATVIAVLDDSHVTLDVDSSQFGALTDSTGIVRTAAPPAAPAAPAPLPDPTPPAEPPDTGSGSGSGGNVGSGAGGYDREAPQTLLSSN